MGQIISITQLVALSAFWDMREAGQPAQGCKPHTYAKNNLGKGSRLAT